MGLRDEKIRSVCWVTDHLRILSIRDSFTEGWTSQWEKHSLEEFRGLKITGGRGAKSWGGVLLPTTKRVKLRKLLVKQSLKVERVVLCLDI
jgi:hypothetical protein